MLNNGQYETILVEKGNFKLTKLHTELKSVQITIVTENSHLFVILFSF